MKNIEPGSIVAMLILIVLMTITITIGVNQYHKDILIAEAIKGGINPMSAKCAIDPVMPLCANITK